MTTPVLVGAVCEVAGFASALMLVGATVKSYANLPEEIAVHFNLRGEPCCLVARGSVLVFPIIAVALFAVLTIVNPAVGLESTVLGPGAPRSAMLTTLLLAGSTVIAAVVGRAVIAFNLGQMSRLVPSIIFMPMLVAAAVAAAALYFKAQAGL